MNSYSKFDYTEQFEAQLINAKTTLGSLNKLRATHVTYSRTRITNKIKDFMAYHDFIDALETDN